MAVVMKQSGGGSPVVRASGSPLVGKTLTFALPAQYLGTLQVTRTLKASPFTKEAIADAVATAANSINYVVKLADLAYNLGCDYTNVFGTTGPLPVQADVPGAPTGVALVGGNGKMTASWTAPANNGGAAITGYRITPSIGLPIDVGMVTSAEISAANDVANSVRLQAINQSGPSPYSEQSNIVTPKFKLDITSYFSDTTLANQSGTNGNGSMFAVASGGPREFIFSVPADSPNGFQIAYRESDNLQNTNPNYSGAYQFLIQPGKSMRVTEDVGTQWRCRQIGTASNPAARYVVQIKDFLN